MPSTVMWASAHGKGTDSRRSRTICALPRTARIRSSASTSKATPVRPAEMFRYAVLRTSTASAMMRSSLATIQLFSAVAGTPSSETVASTTEVPPRSAPHSNVRKRALSSRIISGGRSRRSVNGSAAAETDGHTTFGADDDRYGQAARESSHFLPSFPIALGVDLPDGDIALTHVVHCGRTIWAPGFRIDDGFGHGHAFSGRGVATRRAGVLRAVREEICG